MYPRSTSSTAVREGENGLSGKNTLTARTAANGAVYQTRIETDRQTDRQTERVIPEEVWRAITTLANSFCES